MKLIEFNPSNVPSRGPVTPSLSVSKTGRIAPNKLAVEKLGAGPGHTMKLFLDQESDSWYLSVSRSSDGFPIRTDSKGSPFIQCAAVAKQMVVAGKTTHYLLGTPFERNGLQIYPLLKQ